MCCVPGLALPTPQFSPHPYLIFTGALYRDASCAIPLHRSQRQSVPAFPPPGTIRSRLVCLWCSGEPSARAKPHALRCANQLYSCLTVKSSYGHLQVVIVALAGDAAVINLGVDLFRPVPDLVHRYVFARRAKTQVCQCHAARLPRCPFEHAMLSTRRNPLSYCRPR
eukprot:scaffold247915_cov32-Tisochrysis_lutea.AAC.4